MLRFLLLIFAFVGIALGGLVNPRRVPQLDGRIVGGESASIESYPYTVSVRYWDAHVCGGSIISSRVILTAAHCIKSTSGFFYSVEVGSTGLGVYYNVYSSSYQVIHEKYDYYTHDYDIALMFLRSGIYFNAYAQPIPLATETPAPGTPAVVTGWGALAENGATTSYLRQVSVEIVDMDVCAAQYSEVKKSISERMLCAGVDGGGKDACQGDSGGPLAANGQLVGIVSWGVGCARPEYAGVYTNVAPLVLWINSQLY